MAFYDKEEALVLIGIAALVLALSGPASAQDYTQPDIVRGLCQKDGCDEFRVLSAVPVTSTARVWFIMPISLSPDKAKVFWRGSPDGGRRCRRASAAFLTVSWSRSLALITQGAPVQS